MLRKTRFGGFFCYQKKVAWNDRSCGLVIICRPVIFSRQKKAPPKRGFFGSGVLGDLYLIGLHSFLTLSGQEGDRLAFAQAFEASAFD